MSKSESTESENLTVLGVTRVSIKNRITLTSDVAKALGTNQGDRIIYYQDKKGQVLVKKG
jgi:bifunctional DNA-binding transcriptional regulator/antitoxin component of YhaV-PrlF toxin-antitoxin module